MRMQTVYAPDGSAHEVSNLNALDLTRHSGFSYQNPIKAETAIPEKVEPAAPKDVAPAPDEVVEFDNLEEEAEVVTGEPDLEAYLNTKDPAWLRTYAEKTYGEKVHGRTGKDKIIEMILAWEEEKLSEAEE